MSSFCVHKIIVFFETSIIGKLCNYNNKYKKGELRQNTCPISEPIAIFPLGFILPLTNNSFFTKLLKEKIKKPNALQSQEHSKTESKDGKQLYHNLKCIATFTLDVESSKLKSGFYAELRFQSATSIKMFCVNFSQPIMQHFQISLWQQTHIVSDFAGIPSNYKPKLLQISQSSLSKETQGHLDLFFFFQKAVKNIFQPCKRCCS